jgi:hypothetical protein
MTPEQQRIAIAEACGWKVHPKDRFIVIPPNAPHSVQPLHTLPDYLNDLNAMHEAECMLECAELYEEWLISICKNTPIWNATAAQRAEAFLRTLNLWNDEA